MIKQYKSILCSCVVCQKPSSSKAINSHYITAHTVEGKLRILKNSKLGIKDSITRNNKAKQTRINNYLLSPILCEKCYKTIPYENRNNKFCGHSCATSYTNTRRPRKKWSTKPEDRQKVCPVSWCKTCFIILKNKRNMYCKPCLLESQRILGSKSAQQNNFGGVRPSKRIYYKNVYLGSTYELKLAKSMDKYGIEWTKSKRFQYIDPNGKSRKYEPDFYLPKYNIYLDPKNDFLINNINPGLGFMDSEKIKIVELTHNIRVLILDKDQLEWGEIAKLVVSESNGSESVCNTDG